MKFAVQCRIKPGSLEILKTLRGRHLEYIEAHKDSIIIGGPTRDENGLPHTMIILLDVASREEADAFIHSEPYTASGQVFESILVQPWSQVLPEASPGALRAEIEKERGSQP